MIWPAAEAATLTLRGSRFVLPTRLRGDEGVRESRSTPERAGQASVTLVEPGHAARTFSLDLINDIATYRSVGAGGVFGEGVLRFSETMTSLNHDVTREFTIHGDQPLSARSTGHAALRGSVAGFRGDNRERGRAFRRATQFHLTARLDVYENGQQFVSRRFKERIDRDML